MKENKEGVEKTFFCSISWSISHNGIGGKYYIHTLLNHIKKTRVCAGKWIFCSRTTSFTLYDIFPYVYHSFVGTKCICINLLTITHFLKPFPP